LFQVQGGDCNSKDDSAIQEDTIQVAEFQSVADIILCDSEQYWDSEIPFGSWC